MQKKLRQNIFDKDWLQTEPPKEEIESINGGYYIPIEKLYPLLDRLNWSTRNYKVQIYKDSYTNVSAHGSLELTVVIDGVERTVTGSYNLDISSAPNGYWNGTLKSDCIKNAASQIGKRLGRELNKEVPVATTTPSEKAIAKVEQMIKIKPDQKVLKKFIQAVEKGDEATITAINNTYQMNIEDATKK